MTVRMPVFFGSAAFAPVFNAIKKAIAEDDYPIEIDCVDIVLISSSFYTLVISVLKAAGPNRGSVSLINVSPKSMKFIKGCKFDTVINIRMIADD